MVVLLGGKRALPCFMVGGRVVGGWLWGDVVVCCCGSGRFGDGGVTGGCLS